MKESKAKTLKFLETKKSATPSKWKENAAWRKANQQWLKKSRQIALLALDYMSSEQMTQKELAKKMQVSPQYISKILKGKENLSLESISKIEIALDVKIINIVQYDNQQKVPDTCYHSIPKLTYESFKKITSSNRTRFFTNTTTNQSLLS